GGQADLQGPRQADDVDQGLGPGQVGDQAQRGLLHAEHRVVGADPQVTGQGQLEAAADGVAADGRDRDDFRAAQPQVPGLVPGDGVFEAGVAGPGQILAVDAFRGEQAQVDP